MMSADLSGVSSGPSVTGQVAYTTPGTYTWVCPAGVYSVSVVCVGAGSAYAAGVGGSPGGGGLAYKNNYSTTPGVGYAVVVGAPGTSFATPQGGMSSFAGALIATAGTVGSGSTGGAGGGGIGRDGGGNGGAGGSSVGTAGAGGAGGYSGNGGAGGAPSTAGANGAGGGGGGGGGSTSNGYPGDGGGVGLLGQGANGAGGASAVNGGAGSAGSAGSGKLYGGAGGLQGPSPTAPYPAGGGAVRIIWPGTTRQFPSTNTGDI